MHKVSMSQKIVFSSLALTCLTLGNLHADSSTDACPPCGTSPRPMRVTARHIESNGIGYNQGYTTLEGFFSPIRPYNDAWVPFLDLRAHVFNNGKMAANAGLGVRYLTGSRAWGANAYYDYRHTTHFHYNQFALGFESLGKVWDFRINGYLPLKETASPAFGDPKFVKFDGHYMIVKRKREFALKGANAEVGAHVDTFKDAPMYFAVGPYYLEGRGGATWGGQLRAAVDLYEYLRLEANTSYDHTFKWIGQGQVSVNIPFGARRQVKRGQSKSCSTAMALSQRAVQRVDRFEIIPVDRKHTKSKAINPATGKPYFFWFVDNTSHSAGTYESPFNTLAAAESASRPNDVIYVFPGDGTSTGMDTGITLQYGQQLLGAGIDQTLKTTVGKTTVPALASGLPMISNANDPTGLGVQLVAANNVVSGLNLQDAIGGLVGSLYTGGLNVMGGTSALIMNNTFSTQNNGSGLNIYGGGNNTVIKNNIFLGLDTGAGYDDGIFIAQGPTTPNLGGTITISNNSFSGANATSTLTAGLDIEPSSLTATSGLSNLTLVISNNIIDLSASTIAGSDGIYLDNGNGGPSVFTCSFNGNQIYLPTDPSFNGISIIEDTGAVGPLAVTLNDNVVEPSPPTTGYDFINNTGNPDLLQIDFGSSNVGTRTGPI